MLAPRDTLRRASIQRTAHHDHRGDIHATNIRTGATKTYEEVTRGLPEGDEGWAWN